MGTGNRVIVVSEHSAKRYAAIVHGLFNEYDSVVLTARGRHFARLAEVLRLLRDEVSIVGTDLHFADEAPEIEVTLVRR